MIWKFVSWLFLTALSALLLLVFLIHGIMNDPELANKPEWSVLQGVEATYRNDVSLQRITVVKNFGLSSLDVIGIRSTKGEPTVWVLASPRIAPLVKQMPQNIKIRLTDVEFATIKSSVELNEETEAFLSDAVE